jgi:hypothetical protein
VTPLLNTEQDPYSPPTARVADGVGPATAKRPIGLWVISVLLMVYGVGSIGLLIASSVALSEWPWERPAQLFAYVMAALPPSAGVLFLMRRRAGTWLLVASLTMSVSYVLWDTPLAFVAERWPNLLIGWSIILSIVIYGFVLQKRGLLR